MNFIGVWEQYDSIVYPGELEAGHHAKKSAFLGLGLFDGESSDQSIDPEDQEKTDTRSLRIYLHNYQENILSISSSSHGISKLVAIISRIYKQLERRKVGFLKRSRERYSFSKKDWDGSPTLIEVSKGSISLL